MADTCPAPIFLKLPASFVMPYPDRQRLKDFRLLKINADGTVVCSPLLHFDPTSSALESLVSRAK